MKKQTTFRKTIEKVWKNRAAIVIAIAPRFYVQDDGAGVCGASDGMESSGACVCDR